MESAEARLLAEQLGRLSDALNSRMAAIETELRHHRELEQEQVAGIRSARADVRRTADDHETRLRAANEGVLTFKVWSSLGGFSSVVSLVAMVKSLFIR